jgi:hypothetical protein
MRTHTLIPRGSVVVIVASLGLTLTACNRAPEVSAAATSSLPTRGTAVDPPSHGNVETVPARPDPCGWITPAEAADILGPLAGAPRRGLHFDDPEPTHDGFACVYTLAPRPGDTPGANANTVSVELRPGDAAVEESGFRAGDKMAAKVIGQALGEKLSPDEPMMETNHTGWDYSNGLAHEFFGRIGHLGVKVGLKVYPPMEWQRAGRLAALVRDRVPDRPFATAQPQDSDDPDACKLLAGADVEAVVGKLKIPPYRSTEESPLADTGGSGCSYYLGNHHVFTIKAEWEMGKQLFGMAAATSKMFGNAAGVPTQTTSSHTAPWDQAATGPDGTLYLLKGDKMLTVVYRTANIRASDAVKLVTLALTRL